MQKFSSPNVFFMFKRIKQFFSALTAKITLKDKEFIAQHLNEKEEGLFWGMNLPDQRHALNVAYTAMQLSANHTDCDVQILIKSALLHDIGKTRGDISTIDKTIIVLMDKYAPAKARKWERFGRGNKLDNLRHAIFIYYYHPLRSAVFLKSCGTKDNVINLVLRHHAFPAAGDCPELVILRRSDDEN